MSIEAMKLALRSIRELVMDESDDAPHALQGVRMRKEKAITALRQAIEQAEKQCLCSACKIKPHTSDCAVHNAPAYPAGECDCGAEKQEPVARKKHEPTIDLDKYAGTYGGYTSQPPRQPLTEEEMWKLWNAQGDDFMEQQAAIAFARAIEAAHGIKGEA